MAVKLKNQNLLVAHKGKNDSLEHEKQKDKNLNISSLNSDA